MFEHILPLCWNSTNREVSAFSLQHCLFFHLFEISVAVLTTQSESAPNSKFLDINVRITFSSRYLLAASAVYIFG